MTERARNDTLLNDLLTSTDQHTSFTNHLDTPRPTSTSDNPLLTERAELQLLREAHTIGTPTLAPDGRSSAAFEQHSNSAASFAGEFKDLVQRYPLQSVLVAGGLGFVFAHRRH